jgi:hypothetical protein
MLSHPEHCKLMQQISCVSTTFDTIFDTIFSIIVQFTIKTNGPGNLSTVGKCVKIKAHSPV